ncbi:MAG: UDP-N-acetylmuramoyl-L-alanyl-D-glutamate--2,6-diaminopimelate ligase [Actinomycetia bacterium]|nr:UDP-N-acetylmuramoyl-L-alanyl-D-glutamate--2,6-diaminopimelate ligase [Actinomycetes bacterium]
MNSFSDNARIARAFAAQSSYGDPSAALSIVGVTGTNGKTTTVQLIASIMEQVGVKARALGTIGSPLTTLGEPELAQALAKLRVEGVEVVAMEVSSHGLDQHRVDAVQFDVTAFSNLTQDHLDYHHDMESYFAAKKRLFLDLASQTSVIAIDTEYGRDLADQIAQEEPERRIITVGTPDAHLYATDVVEKAAATSFELIIEGVSYTVAFPLVGYHNVSNALLAAGCTLALGVDASSIAAALESVSQVPGRLQRCQSDAPFNVFVDYAHTPDALERALIALRDITEGKLTVVFGCGGDRDTDKRPKMGSAATDHADKVIVTTDNPRSEDPASIIEEIVAGIDEAPDAAVTTQIDRATAIDQAIAESHAGDTILIAGKGHETYQIFADKTIDFDDVKVAGKALARAQRNRE